VILWYLLAMIASILPAGVAAAEQFGEFSGTLLPEEEALVRRAVPKRRSEFAAGRACARRALEILGLPSLPILSGSGREPLWPHGVVGSITHCDGYCAAVVAGKSRFLTIGIDAEAHLALPPDILSFVARADEIALLSSRENNGLHWDRLLFSAKESVFKAWYPLTGSWLDFQDATVDFDPGSARFQARIHASQSSVARAPIEFSGRYVLKGDHILTLVAVPA